MKIIARGFAPTERPWSILVLPKKTNSSSRRSERSCGRWRYKSSRMRKGDAKMIAVIFEVWPKPAHKKQYLDLAAELKPILETIDGFISVERFESLTEKGKILSLSFFRDEAAVAAWRNVAQHRKSQGKGRATIFENYRLRIAGVIRDYGMNHRAQGPKDSRPTPDPHSPPFPLLF